MVKSQVEFFESLKPYVGEDGARLIAEAFPPSELVTKDYLDAKLGEFKAEMRSWMLSFFVPLWIGVYGTLAALIVSIFVAR